MAFRCPPEMTLRNALRSFSAVVPRKSVAQSSNAYRAIICKELGKPLEISHRNPSPLSAKQVRVAVEYAAINFSDLLTVAGQYQVKPPLPFVPGAEFSGRVTEVGSDVSKVTVGDCVVGLAGVDHDNGAFADEILTDDSRLFRIENGSSTREAAAVSVSYGTAYVSLVRHGRIQSGDVVLVTAAAGALGLATVDLAANVFGAKVIGVCGGADKCQLVKSYGAQETIDYSSEDVKDRVKQLTRGKGIDIFVDMVGGKVFEDCLRCMAFDGRVLTLGYASGQIPKIPANLLLVKNFSVHGVFWGHHALTRPEVFEDSVVSTLKLWKDGKIRPHIGKVFPLHEVNQAMKYVASRQSTGKVLLQSRTQ